MAGHWTFVKKNLFDPRITFYIFFIFMVVYIYFLHENGAFTERFMNFGPSKDTYLLSMRIDTWNKVYMLWIIGFSTAFFTNYYKNVSYDFVFSKVWNPAFKEKLNISKLWAIFFSVFDPIILYITRILNLFVNLTMELQYIVPGLLGILFARIPYSLFKIEEKSKQFAK